MKAYLAQTRAELTMTLRRGESLLATFAIPVGVLLFFSYVDVLRAGGAEATALLLPATMALAVIATSMVSLGIATGFERHYLVLKRLGGTPLGRHRLLAAKATAVLVVEAIQLALLVVVGSVIVKLPAEVHLARVLSVTVAGTAAFAGIGMLMAGTLKAELNLALANGLFLYMMLVGGVVVPVEHLPGPLAAVAAVLPSASLVQLMRWSLGGPMANAAILTLTVWGAAAPAAAAVLFRWE